MNCKDLKKINVIIGLVIATCFTLSAMAADLSDQTIQQCATYLNNPTEQNANQTALKACYDNYFCSQYSQGEKIANCSDKLDNWFEEATSPKSIVENSTPAQKEATPAASANTTPVAPSAPSIPTEFHSTQESTTPVQAPIQAPSTTTENKTTQQSNQTEQQQQKNNNNKKPSINWF